MGLPRFPFAADAQPELRRALPGAGAGDGAGDGAGGWPGFCAAQHICRAWCDGHSPAEPRQLCGNSRTARSAPRQPCSARRRRQLHGVMLLLLLLLVPPHNSVTFPCSSPARLLRCSAPNGALLLILLSATRTLEQYRRMREQQKRCGGTFAPKQKVFCLLVVILLRMGFLPLD